MFISDLLYQDLAVGQDADGNSLKNVKDTLKGLLRDEQISSENKARLIICYMITQGVTSQEIESFIELGKLKSKDVAPIKNLTLLGFKPSSHPGFVRAISKLFKKFKGTKTSDVDYALSRYVPKLKQVADSILNGTLSESEFPYVKKPPSKFNIGGVGSKKEALPSRNSTNPLTPVKGDEPISQSLLARAKSPVWMPKKKEEEKVSSISEQKKSGYKLHIFVAGGVTLSETRSTYELEQEYPIDIAIGKFCKLLN